MQVQPVTDYIVNWLDEYCEQSGLKGFIVGVSGGIDSAVTSVLCAKTGRPTIVASMPISQVKVQLECALVHMKWLTKRFTNVKSMNINLTVPFNAFKNILPNNITNDLSMANSRSRMRMMTLYALAMQRKLLVVGTGNKIEDLGIGFYTKYGDGGVDISPIAGLMKSQVYAIGKKMDISNSIIEAVPTDGLWDDARSDESQIGATYSELETAMEFSNGNDDFSKLNNRSKEVLDIYTNLRIKNYHKMNPIPICKIPENLF